MQHYSLIQYGPSHVCLDQSAGASRYRHWHGSNILDWHCVASTFLRPFAHPALLGFDAPMDALTPGRRLFVSLSGTLNSVPFPPRSPFLTCSTFQPFRPQPPCCHFPFAAFARYLSRKGRRVYPPGRPYFSRRDFAVARSEVRPRLAGSPTGLAESGSSSYGLVVHLPLLSTPPRGDAVTVNYRLVTKSSRGLAPRRSNTFKGALARTVRSW
jgi:hypothetical protein